MSLKDLTPERLKVYEVIQRIRMAWVFLYVVLFIFTVLIPVVVWAAINERPRGGRWIGSD